MTTLLLGGGGLLGSGFRARLGPAVVRPRVPWGDRDGIARALRDAVEPAAAAGGPVRVVWAAGVGHVGAAAAPMRAETDAVVLLCDALRRVPGERLTLVFASSAGALFGGHGAEPVGDATPPAPVTDYGHEKLRQEQEVRRLADETGCRAVVCRYSNLYGLAGGRLPARGLVAVALRASRLRQPMTVYVSPDTRRDHVYTVDAAAESLRLAEAAAPGVTVGLVRDGRTRTVADVLALVGRVARRRVPVNYADRPETRLQPRVLRFEPPVRGPGSVRRTPMEVAVQQMLRAPVTR